MNTTTYIRIPDEPNNGMLYKGSCTFEYIFTLPDFDFHTTPETDAEALSVLRKRLSAYEIIVFLGTWCEDSHDMIPRLYHVLKAADYPLEQLRMYAVDREKQSLHDEADTYQIRQIPVVILRKDGREQGRITEQVQQSVEQDLAKIIHSNLA